jgi:hypothetical protein
MASTGTAADGPGADEAPWPVLARPEPPLLENEPATRDGRRGSALRIAALLGLLALVTAAGIAAGRSLAPSSPAATTAATTTAAATPPTPPVVHKVVVRWGPLTVQPYGKLPPGPSDAAAAVVGPTLAVIGGTGSGRVLAGRLGGRLEPVARLSQPRAAAQAFALGGRLYVLGGEQGRTPADDLVRIDLATGRGRTVAKFVEPLAEAGVAVKGGAVYLAGGWTGEKYATAVLKFTPPEKVDLVTRLPEGLRSPAVVLLGQTLYVAGGRTENGLSRDLFAVDLSSGAVTRLGALPTAVEGALLVSSGTKLYLLGGTGASGKPSAAVVRIDPATGRPVRAGRMPKALAGGAAVPVGSRTVVVDPRSGLVYRIS